MKRYLKTSFLLLFTVFLLAVPNMLTAQELDDDFEIDTIEKVEKHPLRVRFVVGGGPAWYSVTTKNDYQQTLFPNEDPYNQLPYSQSQAFNYYDWYYYWERMSGYRITGVRPAFRLGFSLGLALDKQISPKIELEVAPTLFLTELTVTYEVELELVDQFDQKYYQLEVMSSDRSANFLEFPVLVKYRPFENPFFLVGGINPKMKLERSMKYFPGGYFRQKKFDMSVDFGVGYQFKKRLGVQVKMSLGLLDVIKGREEDPMFFYLPLESVRTNRLEIALVF